MWEYDIEMTKKELQEYDQLQKAMGCDISHEEWWANMQESLRPPPCLFDILYDMFQNWKNR